MRHVSSSFIKFHQELLFTPNKLSPLLDLVLLHAGYHLHIICVLREICRKEMSVSQPSTYVQICTK